MATGAHEHLPFQGVASTHGHASLPEEPSSAGSDLHIHTLDELLSDVRRRRGPVGTAASVVGHVLLAGAVVCVPLLTDTPLPVAERGVRAFLATPLELAPPPPPPPPPPARAADVAPRVQNPESAPTRAFVAPIVTPADIVSEAGLDLGIEGGVAGGVEGGVPGGVLGGVIGGLPEAPPAPVLGPLRVGGTIREPRKLKAAPPVYPEAARDARIQGVVILECLVDPQGRVAEVKVLRSLPLLGEAAVDAVRQWVYTPTLMDGVPVPILMTVTVRFELS